MWAQLIVFSASKEGYEPAEWQDGASGGVVGAAGDTGTRCRFVVVDGATRAYDVRRWVDQLVSSFMPPGPGGQPDLERRAMSAWMQTMQDRWQRDTPATTDYIEQRSRGRGAMATFLGAELTGLNGRSASWRAAAIGDTVLFHVRDGYRLTHFPPLRPADFGLAPWGISTRSERLGAMSEHLLFDHGPLEPGDTLFAATDALAKWMIMADERCDEALWPALGSLTHPAAFDRLVADQRHGGGLDDDDVTLMRIRVLAGHPSALVVCL